MLDLLAIMAPSLRSLSARRHIESDLIHEQWPDTSESPWQCCGFVATVQWPDDTSRSPWQRGFVTNFQWPDTAESPWQRVFVTKFHGCAPQVAHGNLRSVDPRRTFFAVRATQDAILMAPFGITIMVAKGLVIVMMNVNLIGF